MLDDAAYPPLNVPKPMADGVWIVDAKPIRAANVLVLPLRMTIFRLGDGDLLLYSPTHYQDRLREAIEALGPIRHLVAPSTGHWMFLRDWQRACPGAKSWAVPELADRAVVRRAGLRFDGLLGAEPPEAWAGAFAPVMFRGPGYGEVNLFHQPSRTLVVADTLLQINGERMPPLSRALALAAGICRPIGRAPVHLRALLGLRRAANAAAARRMVALAPERIIPAHGDVIEHDAADHLRRSLRWLEDGGAKIGLTLAGVGLLAAATAYAATREPPRRRKRRRVSRW